MTIRTLTQVAAGVLAGAVLVGAPAIAVASQDDGAPSTKMDMSQMMSGAHSSDEMTDAMTKMMKDPSMRKQMASMMSEAMSQMPGMGADDSGKGMSGMGGMHGMGAGKDSTGDHKP